MELCFIDLTVSRAKAMWEELSWDKLVATSDLIAVGEIIGEADITMSAEQPYMHVTVLRVDEILKGKNDHGIALIASPSASRNSNDLPYKRGDRGLWFLRAGPPGTAGFHVADHPQRFVDADRASEEVKRMRKRLDGAN